MFEVEIGKAKLVQEGDDISIITYGAGVHWAIEYAEQHKETSIEFLI
jgi:2-oxoisovalerate dehydrogenase E1 component